MSLEKTMRPSLRPAAKPALAAAALAALCAACLDPNQTDAFKVTTGTLDVTLETPPDLPVSVTVTGPEKFSAVLKKSDKLIGLAPGDYTLTPGQVTLQTSVIDSVWYAQKPSALLKVAEGKTLALSVKYELRPGSSSLWMSHFGDSRLLGGWLGWELMQGGGPSAASRILSSYQQIAGMALDADGTLWVLASDDGASTFVTFPPAAQAIGEGQPAPIVIAPNQRLSAFTFDAHGGVWAASAASASLVHYPAAQVAGGDLLVPDVKLLGTAHSLSDPRALAFDSVGNLWVATGGALGKYSPRQLLASGYFLPAASIPVTDPRGLAFDQGGNLWVSSAGHLLQFSTAQLGGSSAAPAVDLDFGDATISGFAFDALGQLWVVRTTLADNRSMLWMLVPGQQGVSGPVLHPYEALATAAGSGAPSLLVMNPTPAGLPLYGAAK
jgi:hypothetical protein